MSGWQPQQYDPRQQRPLPPAAMPPQFQRQAPPARYDNDSWQASQQFGDPRWAPQQYPQAATRRKRRVFMWVFLAVQLLFIILIIAGIASASHGPSAAAQAAKTCANNGWQGLFSSRADCDRHYAVALRDAGSIGTGIGVAVIVFAWVIVDFFLGLGYGIYRLAGRR